LKGEVLNLTGVSDPYEEPLAPEVVVQTDREALDESVTSILRAIDRMGWRVAALVTA
jgi:adenylylsulfate kinase-like enzyme